MPSLKQYRSEYCGTLLRICVPDAALVPRHAGDGAMVPGAGPGLGRVKMRRYHRHPPQSYLLLLFTYTSSHSYNTSVSCTHISYMFIFQVCYASDSKPDEV